MSSILKTPTGAELEALAAERALNTVERFKPNDFYGHAGLLKRVAGLPAEFVIRAVMPHGPSFCSRLWEKELRDPCAQILAYSQQQRMLYGQQSPHKTVQVIGSPVLYAARQMQAELDALRAHAAGTLVFPTHSTHHVTVEFDTARLVDRLRAVPAQDGPVRVCLYWRDIQLGRHREYLEAGFECVTAGHMFDPEFVPRLLRLLAGHRQLLVNKLGTCVYYAAALGLPVHFCLQNTTYSGPNPALLAELSPSLDLPAAVRFAATAQSPGPEAWALQQTLAREELGAGDLLSPEALRACLEALPPLPATPTASAPAQPRPAAPGKNGSLIDVTVDGLAAQLRPLVAGHPRRVPGRIKLDGRPFAYADLHSLYHQAQQIFGQKLYDFQPASDPPLIIDGGAHIGLASLFFARRFPGATIHAFEADPKIAELLAGNAGAFELKKVKVHGQALWTSDQGVTFAATADDSGHVADVAGPGSAEKATRVPSVRLRDFLAQQPRPVDLLKLDIEGAEFAVLQDCDGGLERVQNLLIEVHRFRDADGQLGELLSVLERNGFEYALGDLHAATWIDSPSAPPFPACKSRHYIVTVFAWRGPGRPGARVSEGARAAGDPAANSRLLASVSEPVSGLDAVLREAVTHLNARREAEALRCFDRAIQRGAGVRSRFGRSVALARLNRRAEAVGDLRALLNVEPDHGRARALVEELLAAETAARLYIASYPRSGNTWLRLLLADVILQQHGYATDTTLPIHADHVIPDLHVGPPEQVDRRLRLPCVLLKSHDRFDKLAPGRAVCVFRQAADSLVSYYHFHRRYPHLAPKAAAGVDAFCRQHFEAWRAHLESFVHAQQRGAEIWFVAYESLHAQPAATLENIVRFVGLTVVPDQCRRAAEHHAFERQQAAEKQAHGDRYAVPFFRQGQVNGAAAELLPETLHWLQHESSALYQAAAAIEARTRPAQPA